MSKKISVGTAVGLMAITAAVTFIITSNVSLNMFNKKIGNVSEKQEFYSKLSEADSFARHYYAGEINEKKLLDDIALGYINGLGDPYAAYYSAEQYVALSAENTGVSTGLGFLWDKDPSGYFRITGIIEGKSAEENGLEPGDIIMAVNNTNIIAYPGGASEAAKLFTAAEGTKVKLHLKRINEDGTVEFINSDLFSTTTEIISVSGRMINSIGYIRISEFNENTPGQFDQVLDRLMEKGAKGYIFDMRGNSGGSINALGQILERLLPAGEIVRAYYNNYDEAVISAENDDCVSGKLAVLINNGTKGEAELFAYALRDNAAAVTVGKTTYGKGVLQETYKLSDGSAVKLSIASLQTASSGNFTGRGLKPDFDVNLSAEIDPFKLSGSEQLLYDEQLIKAVEAAETN